MRNLAYEAHMERQGGLGCSGEYYASLTRDEKIALHRDTFAACYRSIILCEAEDRALARERWRQHKEDIRREAGCDPRRPTMGSQSTRSALCQDTLDESSGSPPVGQFGVSGIVSEHDVVVTVQLGENLSPIDGIRSSFTERGDQIGAGDRIERQGVEGHGELRSGEEGHEHAPALKGLNSPHAESAHASRLPSARRPLFEFQQFFEEFDGATLNRYLDTLSYDELNQVFKKALNLRAFPPGLDPNGVYLRSHGYHYSREVSS